MTALLKSLLNRKPELTPDEFISLNESKSALQDRMQHLLKSTQSVTIHRPTTDRFGRALH